MFEKNMKIAYLLDFYAQVLDEHTRDIMRAYYNDDLSLAEIAEDEGISRQGIRHIVKKGEERLEFFEEKLGIAKMHFELGTARSMLFSIADSLESCTDLSQAANSLKNIAENLLKGN